MADEEYNFVEEQAAPPLPAEANGAEDGGQSEGDRKRSRDRSGERRRSRSRDRKRRSRSKSRERRRSDRDRSRDKRRGDRDRSRDRDRRRGDRDRSRDRRRRSSSRDRRDRRRSPTPPHVREERQRQAEMEALDRDTRTVFAYNLNLKAEEKEIFQFFVRAGPLNDIKIITDKTTGRSKGFAYIEFQRKEDVINALALTGQPLMGQAVMVKMSEAEKNLAWEAAEQAKRLQKEQGGAAGALGAPALPPALPAGMMMPGMVPAAPAVPVVPVVAAGPARLALTNLPIGIAETDLRPIFEPFGALDFITLQRDTSARPTGNGFVQYRLLSDATKAKENLSGLDIVGYKLGLAWTSVDTPVEAMATVAPPPGPPPPGAPAAALGGPETLAAEEGAEGGGGGLKLTGQSRAALMSKLAANAGLDVSNVPQLPVPQAAPAQPQVPTGLALEQGMLGPASPIPTQCLLLKNMFDPAEETEPNWDAAIREDVGSECAKYGPVEHVWVDSNSRGFVYVKFSAVASAVNAQRALHGRWFAHRQVAVDFQFTPIYNQHFGL